MLRASAILALLLCSAAVAAQPTWITMQNADFRAYSSASERATRDALNQFERVRGFFVQLTGAAPPKGFPISVVIFGTEKEYQPFRLNAFAVAYYTGSSDRDLIVVGKLGNESSQLATHEYTHLIFKHGGYKLPPWLNEGLAEFFSTLRQVGNDTQFGDVLPGRLQALEREPWVPMQTILAADHNSPYYNETQQAGSLYNQSWAFVHMLATSDQYRGKFWGVVTAINRGTPSAQALETAYGVPIAELEAALRSYVRGSKFKMLSAKIRLDATEHLTGQPADPFDVHEVEAELLMGLRGRQADARSRFEELTREDPKRPEPWGNLGYLAWRDQKPEEAAAHFGKAFELGNRNPRLLLNFAKLSQHENPEGALAALTALVDLEPNNVDACLTLADLQLSRNKPAEALTTIRPIRAVETEEQRDRLLYMRAFASMQLGDLATARSVAENLKSVSSSESYRTRADEVLRVVNRK